MPNRKTTDEPQKKITMQQTKSRKNKNQKQNPAK
jgi:hypothetical protein